MSGKGLWCIGVSLLLLSGCALGPTSADAAFGGNPTPSASMPAANPPNGRDGIYVGTADVEINGDLSCPPHMTISNLRVVGNALRFGGFRATILADGSVLSTGFRGMWLTGRFEGARFVGHVNAFGDMTGFLSSCQYRIDAGRQGG